MSKGVAIFPGSFDPITKGHLDIVGRALLLFDTVVVAVGGNMDKECMFSADRRRQFAEFAFSGEPRVEVDTYKGLTVEYCRFRGASVILRGLRSSVDFEFEKVVAQANVKLAPDIETVFLPASVVCSCISSTVVRDILRNGGDCSAFLPEGVMDNILTNGI